MMKMLVLSMFISASAFSQSSPEEALILNQELQFLENSARDMEVIRPQVSKSATEETASDELSLERTYFSDSERDEIRTRAAAPKRVRSF